MRILIIIPARAGSKGLPGKNSKLLNGKPLISYTIEYAEKIKKDDDIICVTSNDETVIEIARNYGLAIPFKRPEELSTDYAGSYEVIMHALNHYKAEGEYFDAVLLLQPTSPLRAESDYFAMLEKFDGVCEMVVSVMNAKENPYFTLFEEGVDGYLEKSKKANYKTRQDCPPVYTFNGSMYLIDVRALEKSGFQGYTKIAKVVMPEERSIDIDTIHDWIITEYFLNQLSQ
jgi:CMP-N,N'-diacetyllegionaminic acid synthase